MLSTASNNPTDLTAFACLQHLGVIKSIHPTTEFEGYSFVIGDAGEILGDCAIGDSIATNGVCLTVTRFDAKEGWFEVGLANETLSRTNLGAWRICFSGRFSGELTKV